MWGGAWNNAVVIISPKNKPIKIKRNKSSGNSVSKNQNQFYFRRKNTMLIEQQLVCDKGKAAKGPNWSSSQAATFKAE